MTDKNTASLLFKYMARNLANEQATSGALLICVLPHHVDAKQSAPVVLKVQDASSFTSYAIQSSHFATHQRAQTFRRCGQKCISST